MKGSIEHELFGFVNAGCMTAVPYTDTRGHKCQIVHDSISSSFYCLRQQYGTQQESELPFLVSLMFCLTTSEDVFNNVFILAVVAYYILTNTSVGVCQCQHIKIYRALLRSMTAMTLVSGKTALIMTKFWQRNISVFPKWKEIQPVLSYFST